MADNSKLPSPPTTLDPELKSYLNRLVRDLEIALIQITQVYSTNWSLSNVPTSGSKTLDADSSDLDTTRKVLSRLLQDLVDRGIIRKAES